MGKTRLELSKELHKIMDNVYYSPPGNLIYPCLIYKLSRRVTRHADNIKYNNMDQYDLTLIDENPDSKYFEKILELDYCSFDRFYTSDNLNHFSFTLYW